MRLFFLLLVIFVCYVCQGNGREISCNKKGFVCYDETRFHQCVHNRGKYVIAGAVQNCPAGLVCRNDADLECEEEIPKEYIITSNVEPFYANDADHRLDEI